MSSATPSSEKWVTLPLMLTKMDSLQRQQNIFNNHETHTTMNRCGHYYSQKYRPVNTVYIEYKSVLTHSQSHSGFLLARANF